MGILSYEFLSAGRNVCNSESTLGVGEKDCEQSIPGGVGGKDEQ